MGRKIPLVSFLCGVLSRKKTPPPNTATEDGSKPEDHPDTISAGDAATESTSEGRRRDNAQPSSNDRQQPLPPPPTQHRRSNSTATRHQRSNSGASKLVASMSMKVLGSKEKKMKQEDSIWKKTIILGEKCRIPDEEEDGVFYDEKGKKISTYHPKSCQSGVFTSYSRQTSCIDQKEDKSRK